MGLSNFDILKIAKHLEIPNFKGVFTRDQLTKKMDFHEFDKVLSTPRSNVD